MQNVCIDSNDTNLFVQISSVPTTVIYAMAWLHEVCIL